MAVLPFNAQKLKPRNIYHQHPFPLYMHHVP
jgi:hypothetical protein